MAGANAIRGSRVGAGPMGEVERGDSAPRVQVTFYCGDGHVSDPYFAADADIPEEWECVQCGLPASQDEDNPPQAPSNQPYKTHLAYVKERRSDAEGAVLLDEALAALRAKRGS